VALATESPGVFRAEEDSMLDEPTEVAGISCGPHDAWMACVSWLVEATAECEANATTAWSDEAHAMQRARKNLRCLDGHLDDVCVSESGGALGWVW